MEAEEGSRVWQVLEETWLKLSRKCVCIELGLDFARSNVGDGNELTKQPLAKQLVLDALGIPEKNVVVVPVKMGPNLKKALEKVSEGNVSGWIRDVIKKELTERYRL